MTNLFMYLTAMSAVSLHSLVNNINTANRNSQPHLTLRTLETNWTYQDDLAVVSSTCQGHRQSPINIETSKIVENLNLRLGLTAYDKPMTGVVINQFPTFQIRPFSYKWSRPNAIISNSSFTSYNPRNDDTYALNNIHFHWSPEVYPATNKSEHQIDGVAYPMEIHIVHTNTKYSSYEEAMSKPDGILIMAVMVVPCRSELYIMDRIIDQLENITNYADQVPIVEDSTWRMLLPSDTSRFYRYFGSLTTPPCYQSVQWIVFEGKLKLGTKQIKRLQGFAFEGLDTRTGNRINWSHQSRPIQRGIQIEVESSFRVNRVTL